MRRRCSWIAVFLLAVSGHAWTLDPDAEDVERALQATRVTRAFLERTVVHDPYGDEVPSRLQQAVRDFEDGLTAVAGQMTAEERSEALASESTSMSHKLMAIAVDRQQQPDLYREIDVWHAPSAFERGYSIMGLRREQHVNERYRLVWEFFLLRPDADQKQRATEALGELGNPASVMTLRHAYEADAHSAHSRYWILSALPGIPCREAVEMIAEVLEESGDQGASDSSHPHGWPASKILVTSVSDLPEGKRSAWLALMRQAGAVSPAFERFSRSARARLGIDRAFDLTYLIPERVLAELSRSRAASERLDRTADEFDATLSEAGDLLVRNEGSGGMASKLGIGGAARIKARLAQIALDRASRPRAYQGLVRTYARRGEPGGVVPPLKRKYATEAYRLVWELLLVMPRHLDTPPEQQARAAEALGAIGNPASAVTLSHAIGVMTQEEVPLTALVVEAQRLLLDALLAMPSAEAAQAIDEGVSDIRRHHWKRTNRRDARPTWDARTHVIDAVLAMPLQKQDAWLAVTDEYWPDAGRLRGRLKQTEGGRRQK